MKCTHIALTLLASISILNIKPIDNQPAVQISSQTVMSDTNALTITLLEELLEKLKQPEYSQEILPHNFSYLIQYLQHGKKSHLPRAYVRSVFKLFSNMLKAAQYVNAYAFSEMIDQLPSLLKSYFIAEKVTPFFKNEPDLDSFDRLKSTINNMLYIKMRSEFSFFKENPDVFLDNLAQQICDIIQEEVTMQQLRQTIIRFIDIGLSKLVWSPEDQEKTWEVVKKISHQLATLLEDNIIDDINDLDDLFWTLIHRYCFFLDITGSNLSKECYDKIKNDLATQQLILLELDDQDPRIESKGAYLRRGLMQAEAKSYAVKKGLRVE